MLIKKKLHTCNFKTKEFWTLFSLNFDKNISELSFYFNCHLTLQFSVGDLCSYFLLSGHCKSDVNFSGRDKVVEAMVAKEKTVEAPTIKSTLNKRSANEKQ